MSDTRKLSAYNYIRDFELDNSILADISQRLLSDINKGLSRHGHENSSVKCFQTYVQDFPTGEETGRYLALDLGGTNFRVLMISLGNAKKFHMEKKTYEFPNDLKKGTAEKMFDYVAECVNDFLNHLRTKMEVNELFPLGFTFSFPVQQMGLNVGIMMKWTKGFNVSGVVGKDVVQLLRESFQRKKIHDHLTPVAILNDTTGTLMSCAWNKPDTRVGLIVGTGTNACYTEKIENIEFFDGDPAKPYMIVNTEWGNFGSDGRLNDILTEYDRNLDSYSSHVNEQIYEKLISGRYLGELMRLIIVKMINDEHLFQGKYAEQFSTRFSLKTEFLSKIERDCPEKYGETKKQLKEIGVENCCLEDLKNLRVIAEALSTRSAALVSAGVATILNKMAVTPVTVGVDGSLYRYHPKYKEIMQEKIRCLTDSRIEFQLMLSEDGSGRGAALVAAVLVCNQAPRDIDNQL
ncbi:hexokinase type 2-like [Planococcus citri]|uniref:hexokinase type 2-like n=1 Tax=Planococcus citri TaxID=170843 RepID=UPI0031F8FE20